jgi:hypothetical protein
MDFSNIIGPKIDLTKSKRLILIESKFLTRNEFQSIERIRRCNVPQKIKQAFIYRLEINTPIKKKILERRKLRKNYIMKAIETQ